MRYWGGAALPLRAGTRRGRGRPRPQCPSAICANLRHLRMIKRQSAMPKHRLFNYAIHTVTVMFSPVYFVTE